MPLTFWPVAFFADFFAFVADFSAEAADFSAEAADFSAEAADFSAAFIGFTALSAATAKPAIENANATAITTVKIFFISFPLSEGVFEILTNLYSIQSANWSNWNKLTINNRFS